MSQSETQPSEERPLCITQERGGDNDPMGRPLAGLSPSAEDEEHEPVSDELDPKNSEDGLDHPVSDGPHTGDNFEGSFLYYLCPHVNLNICTVTDPHRKTT
jgi:hypothetical protein